MWDSGDCALQVRAWLLAPFDGAVRPRRLARAERQHDVAHEEAGDGECNVRRDRRWQADPAVEDLGRILS